MILPVLNNKNQVISIINFRKKRSYLPLDAVIMAGGKGYQTSPFNNRCSKTVIKSREKSQLWNIIWTDYLSTE